jgi:phosphatidylinositol alpha-1,6-mannosyltransferase
VTVVTLKAPAKAKVAARAGRRARHERVIELPRVPRVSQRFHVAALNAVALIVALFTRPDAVLAGHAVVAPAARVIAFILRRPYVLVLHAQEIPHRPDLVAAGITHSAATVAVSSHARAEAIHAGAPGERIVVVNPGVDIAELGERVVRADDARPTIVTIARMVDHYKGHDVMIKAVDRLRRDLPPVRWVVIGDGPLRETYERDVAARGLLDHVEFTGSVSDRKRDELLERADVFAMPSRVPSGGGGEGFGLVFLEAAERGIPVVAGNEGGALDAVLHERTGLLVEPRDPDAVANAIRRVLTQPGTAQSMSKAARAHAESRSWAVFAGEVRALLLETVARGTRPSPSANADAPIRVLAVSHTAAYGGAERSLLTQLVVDADGGAIEPIIAAPPGALSARAIDRGVRTVTGPAFDYSFRVRPTRLALVFLELIKAGRELAGIARAERAEVIHANSVRAALIAAAARPFGAPPFITHVRDCMPESLMSRATATLTRRASAHVVANSEYAADVYRKVGGGVRPSVVYNAIDPVFAGSAQSNLRPPQELTNSEGPVVTMVSQLTPWKGQDIAIRAFAAAREFAPGAKLVLAGSVKFSGETSFENIEFEARLHRLAERLDVADDVLFVGELDDVRPLLSVSDILLMPSWAEPFGRAAIEAMASGCAVIATNVGGPREFIEDGVNGLLADPRDLTQWVAAIKRLLLDDELRAQIGKRAQGDALRRFSAGSPETRLVHVYGAISR